MININLLPRNLRPIRRSPVPYLIVGAAGVVVLLAVFLLFMTGRARVHRRLTEIDSVEAELQLVRASAEKVSELEAKRASIAQKDKAIKDITSDSIVWSEQLYYLARLTPRDVWLKEIEVENKSRTKIVKVANPTEGQPTTKKVQVPYQALKICGYALSPKEEIGVTLVGVMVRAIENDAQFSKHFKNPNPRITEEGCFSGINVKEFEINCEIAGSTAKKGSA